MDANLELFIEEKGLEKKTLSRIAKGSFIFFTGDLLLMFTQFFTTIILARTLEQQEYGSLSLALSIYSFSSVFLGFGLGNMISSNIAQNREKRQFDIVKRFILSYSKMLIFLGSLIFLVFITFSFFTNTINANLTKIMSLSIGCYIMLSGFRNFLNTIFYGFTYYKIQIILGVTESLLRLFIVIIMVTFINRGLNSTIILIYPVSLAIASLIVTPHLMKILSTIRTTKSAPSSIWKKALKEEGFWITIGMPLKQLQAQLPIWILNHNLGTKSIAVYSIAESIFSIFSSILRSIESATFPIISEKSGISSKETAEIIQRTTKYAFWIAILLILMGWFFMPYFINLVFSSKYSESTKLCQFFLFRLIVIAFIMSQRPLLYALKSQKVLFYKYLISSFSVFFLMIVSVSKFGIYSTAIAIIITGIVQNILHWASITKLNSNFKINFYKIIHFDEYDLSVLLAILKRLGFTRKNISKIKNNISNSKG